LPDGTRPDNDGALINQGMVITSLMAMIVGNATIKQDAAALLQETQGLTVEESDSRRVMLGYMNGEYVLVQQMISVLNNGKIAKLLTDRAIDSCQHMQNLRSCIYDYRARLQDLTVGTPKYQAAYETAVNYLVRYVYLVM
jgi:hypothetical protein